jgi:hypothetical protein
MVIVILFPDGSAARKEEEEKLALTKMAARTETESKNTATAMACFRRRNPHGIYSRRPRGAGPRCQPAKVEVACEARQQLWVTRQGRRKAERGRSQPTGNRRERKRDISVGVRHPPEPGDPDGLGHGGDSAMAWSCACG